MQLERNWGATVGEVRDALREIKKSVEKIENGLENVKQDDAPGEVDDWTTLRDLDELVDIPSWLSPHFNPAFRKLGSRLLTVASRFVCDVDDF